jgi:hypothetical protein
VDAYSVSTLAFRQTPEHRAALDLPVHARRPGRYHDRGDHSPLYASSSPEAAMAEFLRQVAKGELSFAPEDVRRLSTLELPEERHPDRGSADGYPLGSAADASSPASPSLPGRGTILTEVATAQSRKVPFSAIS